MRRFCQFGTFLLLVAGILLLWKYRFERSPGHPVYALADLRGAANLAAGGSWDDLSGRPALRLGADERHRNVVARMAFPALGPVDFIHVRYEIASRRLQPGKQIWEDGRGIIEWHTPADSAGHENDPIFSTRHDHEGKPSELVMRPRHSPAVPVLRAEHLGVSGEMEIRGFEVTVLKERWIWKIGRWLLMAGWIVWLYTWIRPVVASRRAGALVAAVVWLFMGLYFVVPGPWKSLRPLGTAFVISGKSAPSPPPLLHPQGAAPVPAANTAPLMTVGEIPQNGDFTLTLKTLVAQSKWILHVALLLAPTLLTACLVGRRQAIILGILFSLAVEAAQIGFGYGSDVTDLVDLAGDAGGILIALTVHGVMTSVVFRRLRAPAFFAAT